MKTNDYDSYAEKLAQILRSGAQKPHALLEKPAMMDLLPDLKGKRVLCVGCGTGEECGELLARGAEVFGFDVSEKSVALAHEAFPEAHLEVLDMHDLSSYDSESFDFIYSSLTLHYSEFPEKVLVQLYRVLKPGAVMQLSVGHPIKWAAEDKRDTNDENKKAFLMGYDTYQNPTHVYGDYLNVTKVTQKPQNYPEITYWNRPISDYLRLFREANLSLVNFVEPKPIPETETIDKEYWDIHSKIPQFMIFILRK
jgi:SAM-dependent methyltransferase